MGKRSNATMHAQRARDHQAAIRSGAREREDGPPATGYDSSQTTQASGAAKDVVYSIDVGGPAAPTMSTSSNSDVPMDDNISDHDSAYDQFTLDRSTGTNLGFSQLGSGLFQSEQSRTAAQVDLVFRQSEVVGANEQNAALLQLVAEQNQRIAQQEQRLAEQEQRHQDEMQLAVSTLGAPGEASIFMQLLAKQRHAEYFASRNRILKNSLREAGIDPDVILARARQPVRATTIGNARSIGYGGNSSNTSSSNSPVFYAGVATPRNPQVSLPAIKPPWEPVLICFDTLDNACSGRCGKRHLYGDEKDAVRNDILSRHGGFYQD